MISTPSIEAVQAAEWTPQFIRPLYETYGFARIPQTIRALLTDTDDRGIPFDGREDLHGRYDTVVLLMVDAFGWRFFEQYREQSPFLRRIANEGYVAKLTSQFPSTTSAHVTTIHTGLPVGQSGIYEWFYYEPLLDTIIAPLLFSQAGDRARETLRSLRADPARLYPQQTLYEELAAQGVSSWVFQHHTYASSTYTKAVTRGAETVAFRTFPEGLTNLETLMERQQGPAYYYIYFDSIDSICHLHGPESRHLQAEIWVFLDTLERLLHQQLQRAGQRTMLLITADHGQVAIDPRTTIYLNQAVPEMQRFLKTNRAGAPLVPAGSSRDMFLYIKDELLDEAQATLQATLAGRADVRRVDELVAQGFFGPGAPSPALQGHLGNLVVLPYRHESVWWYEPGRFEQFFYGSHGGLTREEMETLLMAQPYGV